jgi:hypothetical protein
MLKNAIKGGMDRLIIFPLQPAFIDQFPLPLLLFLYVLALFYLHSALDYVAPDMFNSG